MAINNSIKNAKKELPPIPNSVTVTVHSSKIAQAQAIYKLEQLTKCKLHQDSEGVFSLMDNKSKKGEFRFYYDENSDQMKMTATFTKPINHKYIEAAAIFAADDQLHDKDKEHRKVVTHFTAGPGVEQEVIDSVEKTFKEQYDNVRKEKNMSLVGKAIADENALVKHGTLPQPQQSQVQAPVPQQTQHSGGTMK